MHRVVYTRHAIRKRVEITAFATQSVIRPARLGKKSLNPLLRKRAIESLFFRVFVEEWAQAEMSTQGMWNWIPKRETGQGAGGQSEVQGRRT